MIETETGMDYNTGRPVMKIAEFGRNIQNMVVHAKTLTDPAERLKAVTSILNTMIILHPNLSLQAEVKQKLFDMIYIIADYDLDVEVPYTIPVPPDAKHRPILPAYNMGKLKHRYYGRTLMMMIEKAKEMEDGQEKETLVNTLACYMKLSYRVWNEDKVNDETIIKQLFEISGGKLTITSINDVLNTSDTNSMRANMNIGPPKKKKKKKKKSGTGFNPNRPQQ